MQENFVPRPVPKRGNKLSGSMKAVAILVILILAGALVFSTCTTRIPTGFTGIPTLFGRVANYTLEAGFHWKNPFAEVIKMDNREQKRSYTTVSFSSDIQQVDILGSINFNINKTTAMTLYKEVGIDYFDTLVTPRLLENLKATFSKYSAEKLISARETLSAQIRDKMRAEMEAYGINIISINIEDIDFQDAFTSAVEEKQVAEQNKLRIQTEEATKTAQAEQEAQRRVIAANAAAEVVKIEAESKKYAGEKEAEMNQKLAESITAELVQYNQVQKWNGVLPMFQNSGGTTLPIIDMTSLTPATPESDAAGD